MTKLKFNLNFGGEEIRTLDDLRENFSVEDVLDNFNNGTLTRWLDSHSYNNELEQVKAIQATDARGIFAELIRILGVSFDPVEIKEDLSLVDYLEGRKKFWADIKANGLDGVDTIRAFRQELEVVKQERDALKQKLEDVMSRQQDAQKGFKAVKQEQSNTQQKFGALEQERGTIRQEPEKLKDQEDSKGIRAEIPIGAFNPGWNEIVPQGIICKITDAGNCRLLTVRNRPRGQDVGILYALSNKMELNGIAVIALNNFILDYQKKRNKTEPLYFYYKEVR